METEKDFELTKAEIVLHEVNRVAIDKFLQDQGLESTPEINEYLSHRVERSYVNIHRLVKEIDYYAHAMKKPLTLALVRHVLAKKTEEDNL